jgi:parvulin-like peptidyl-prolyl isomerase
MNSAFEEELVEAKDYTRWIWLGVVLLFVGVVAAMWLFTVRKPAKSVSRASHILITFDSADPAERDRALKLITSIRERIAGGESFTRMAEQYSNDPANAYKGGDLGYNPQGTFAKPVDDYIWTAEIGQLSDVIQSQFGFHLVVVTDRRLSSADELLRQQDEEYRRRFVGVDGAHPADRQETTGNEASAPVR